MKKIVILGGGTGLSTLLRAIKYIKDIEISAIVSVSDDGGSTGILRQKFTIPAVGDLRKVIGSLSKERKELNNILEYRFKNTNTDLDGHSIGNLIILSQILMNKSFSKAIINTCHMLNIEGSIIPVSNNPDTISAEFTDGTIVNGESKICKHKKPIKRIFLDNHQVKATYESIKAIMNADIIILGIGSLYTSLIPNLIYPNIIKALKKTKAKILYFANLFTEPGETDDMSILDHIKALEKHTFPNIIHTTIINSSEIPKDIEEKYNKKGQFICKNDIGNHTKVIKVKLLDFRHTKYAHHDNLLVEDFFKRIISDDFCL